MWKHLAFLSVEPKKERRKNMMQKNIWITENFPNLLKGLNLQIWKKKSLNSKEDKLKEIHVQTHNNETAETEDQEKYLKRSE